MTFPPAPLVLDEVLNTAWLSTALSEGRDPVKVVKFDVVETLGPSALKIRIKLDFDGGTQTEVPNQICIKGIFDPNLKPWLENGAQQAEAEFYRQLALKLGVRVPQSYYSGFDPETMAGLVIMEDLIPKGIRFLSALSPYTPIQSRQSLDQLARLHGGTWNRDPSAEPWVNSKLETLATGRAVSAERITEMMQGERAEGLPEDVRSGERIYDAIRAIATKCKTIDECYIHGDCHAGNVWEGPDGIGLVDWQMIQRGNWAIDFAYHINAVLDIEDRRRSERELLAFYLERLARHGGKPPREAEAWELYRAMIPYGYLMWAMTQRVDPIITSQFVQRLGNAVVDHGSFELLGV